MRAAVAMPPEIFIHGPLRFGCCASLLGSMAGCLQATSLRDHLRTALLASLNRKGRSVTSGRSAMPWPIWNKPSVLGSERAPQLQANSAAELS